MQKFFVHKKFSFFYFLYFIQDPSKCVAYVRSIVSYVRYTLIQFCDTYHQRSRRYSVLRLIPSSFAVREAFPSFLFNAANTVSRFNTGTASGIFSSRGMCSFFCHWLLKD